MKRIYCVFIEDLKSEEEEVHGIYNIEQFAKNVTFNLNLNYKESDTDKVAYYRLYEGFEQKFYVKP